MDTLLSLADMMGINIVEEPFLPTGWLGAYSLVQQTIYLLSGLTLVTARCVLAHELGHAVYKHGCSDESTEWHADRWAAQQLIDAHDYFVATRDSPTLEVLAERLNVTPRTASTYVRTMRGPSNFLSFQPVKLASASPTYNHQTCCVLAA